MSILARCYRTFFVCLFLFAGVAQAESRPDSSLRSLDVVKMTSNLESGLLGFNSHALAVDRCRIAAGSCDAGEVKIYCAASGMHHGVVMCRCCPSGR